jgi:hypothetical protein
MCYSKPFEVELKHQQLRADFCVPRFLEFRRSRKTGNGDWYKMYKVKNRKIVSGCLETDSGNLDVVS